MTEVPPATKHSGLLDGGDEVLTADEAAELLKLSKKTVLRHARRGELPATKVGRVWRFRRSELLAFLTSGPA
ncbi:MAG: helix-turn-helix domain-containing protein [Gammaproteobacteria bacterium]|nr:helix-turn-helix domain-containing protein [Gammaproteobacteria bacterium]